MKTDMVAKNLLAIVVMLVVVCCLNLNDILALASLHQVLLVDHVPPRLRDVSRGN